MPEGSLAPFIEQFYPEYYLWKDYPAAECVPIRRTKEKWGILGNFAPTPLVVDGVKFANSEQLYQMMKFSDREALMAIYASKGFPIKWAAQKAEKSGLRREDWGRIVIDVMKFCLQAKHDQSEEFRQALAQTAGLYIVEDQTNKKRANTWGAVKKGEVYEGSNLLGRLLM